MLQGQNRCSEPPLACASRHGDGAGRSQGGSFQKRLFCLQSSSLWCKEILVSEHLGTGLRCELLVWAPFTAKSCSWFLIGRLRASPLTCAHSVRLLFLPMFQFLAVAVGSGRRRGSGAPGQRTPPAPLSLGRGRATVGSIERPDPPAGRGLRMKLGRGRLAFILSCRPVFSRICW